MATAAILKNRKTQSHKPLDRFWWSLAQSGISVHNDSVLEEACIRYL